MSEFGRKLRQMREGRGMSQEELGAKLKTSRQVISRYENSQRSPKISIVVELAKALDVDLNYFDDSVSQNENEPTTQPEQPIHPSNAKLLKIAHDLNEDEASILADFAETLIQRRKK